MVPPAPDARASGAIAPNSNRVSGDRGLRCRETRFPGQRKMRHYVARSTDQGSRRRSGWNKTPPIRGLSRVLRKSPQTCDCVVADAVGFERVSASRFPANREINRECYQIRPPSGILAAGNRTDSIPCDRIPYGTEEGFFCGISGDFFYGTGKIFFPNRQLRAADREGACDSKTAQPRGRAVISNSALADRIQLLAW